jgi:D-alanyl-D-alanine carboxypeptidase/D-alanyl-D-alanine-endopeptidase (penicillin-binding protein 4)
MGRPFAKPGARALGVAVLACALTLAGVALPDGPSPPPAPASPAPSTSAMAGTLQAAVHALVSERVFKDAVISLEIADVDTGQILASFHEHAAVNPASNAKLYTAATALATGPARVGEGELGDRQSGAPWLRRPIPDDG